MDKLGITDKDQGFNRIMRDLNALSKLSVEVGIQADAGSDDEGNPIIVRAVANEFGTETIPERSFVRSAYDENLKEIESTKLRVVEGVKQGKLSPQKAAELLGQLHEGHIKQKIRSNIQPANAPATIARKGSSSTLVDSGQMAQTIRYVVKG